MKIWDIWELWLQMRTLVGTDLKLDNVDARCNVLCKPFQNNGNLLAKCMMTTVKWCHVREATLEIATQSCICVWKLIRKFYCFNFNAIKLSR